MVQNRFLISKATSTAFNDFKILDTVYDQDWPSFVITETNTTFITQLICFQLRQFSCIGEKLGGFLIPLKKVKLGDQRGC